MKKTILAAFSASLVAVQALPAAAQETPHAAYRETGSSKDWVGIYSPDRGTGKTTASCAVYSRPKTTAVFEGNAPVEVMRGELAAFIAWNGNAVTDKSGEISFMVGTAVIEGRNEMHGLTVDGDARFDLVGVGDRLYVMAEDDAAAIAALRKGHEMVVTARTTDGRIVKDAYSLMGVQGMTNTQKKECH